MPRKTGATARLDARGFRMWYEGATDPEIAERLGCSKAMVCMWRKKKKLSANAPTGSLDWTACRESMLQKQSETVKSHELGMTDRQAAAIIGVTPSAFRKRRVRAGLKLNSARRKKCTPGTPRN